MKFLIALLAVMAVAAANPLPLVQIIVNVDASGNPIPSPTDIWEFQPPHVELPILDPIELPAENVIVATPVLPSPKPEPVDVGTPEPVQLGTPELPVILPGPAVLPDPALPELIVPDPVVLPDTLN